MKVRFKNPPINELIIGVYFNPPIIPLRSEHIGLLWSRFRDDFPKVEQREPLFVGAFGNPSAQITSNEFPFMPRYWFVSEDEVNLIQIQKDAFLLNWRKREAEYPHFDEHLKPSFDKYLLEFKEFLHDEFGKSDIKIGLCELTYVDLIEPCDFWRGPQDTSRLIPSFVTPDFEIETGSTTAFNCVFHHEAGPELQLRTSIRTAVSTAEPKSPRLVLEFKALGQPAVAGTSGMDKWYNRAHDVIISQFLGMTDEQIQRTYWVPEENAQ